ncbi:MULTISPECIES: NAD(P)H-quinone dehydrogenase [Cryobacterium]|uniref:NAD(P)H-quinone dehydrogenase n=1 Tax=Cryobacterium zongtaii TaxID=1259217 RepID=A0A2S3ZM14_9MICO|nr:MULTISPECIES: NAD(P)H-quinone dehydrogenase [Cryobacterium]ASD21179.1 NAD(P)H-quinone dehydrogenase [Cryobacterium sp. LW097]MEC5183112.1 pyruvate/2-oxoglutarate dehydrogenase complex dihydrolipoamide dehydrogenase (E3) component [Cryobacterium sp. MP_3.1]POH64125.1 NAD(P)H-quinone dehydrogenase [Cryobacterium zongtaii]POH69291.1 NAD(P)H-quinone dehydrogenase [Cryobacterium zongtaii]POH69749.1 NAD(P)H-quinone dehydrogenase [Cryobacterium zongtaii]
MPYEFERKQRIIIIGGGPGGYEAALAGAQQGAEVTLIERVGVGGAAVLTDVVPSKSLIATAEASNSIREANDLGVQFFVRDAKGKPLHPEVAINLAAVNKRLLALAREQSEDMRETLVKAGVKLQSGHGRLDGRDAVIVSTGDDGSGTDFDRIEADTIVLSVGASPRTMPTMMPDGERILTWTQLYNLKSVPKHLIVVGSGVTGAEFASAYRALGAEVTLVSSRDQVLPGEDVDAAAVIENVFKRNGMVVLNKSRAATAERTDTGVLVTLTDGRTVEGSHCLIAVGAVPNTQGLGLAEAGVQLDESGHIRVNRVARTSIPNIYAAGDCTTEMPLASVASMMGRTAVYHAMGDAVNPIEIRNVAANIFTQPEIATVGWTQKEIEEGVRRGEVYKMPLESNPRAKMMGIKDGFVKLIASRGTGTVIGGVIVGPKASELIFPLTLAVEHGLTVDEVAEAFTVYPSLTGSITDAARAMHKVHY